VRFPLAIVSALLALSGCASCVPVNGTYAEVWAAAHDVMASIPEQGADLPRREFFGQGTIAVVSFPRDLAAELHHHVQIEPVDFDNAEKREHKVCIRVRQLEPAFHRSEAVQARRREDLEKMLGDELVRRLRGPD
jgi:hypothetical protein